METILNMCLSFGLALAVFTLNLQVQSVIIAKPPNIGSKIITWGWSLFAVGTLWALIGLSLIVFFTLPTWTWISVGIILCLLAIAIIIQGKKVTTSDLEKLGKTFGTISYVVIVIAVIIIVISSIMLLNVVSQKP